MFYPAVLLLVTSACISVTKGRFSSIGPRSSELAENYARSSDFRFIPNYEPFIAPISPIPPTLPAPFILPIAPDILLKSPILPPIALPPGWCIPDIIKIPLVPCSKPTQPLSPVVIPISQPSPLPIPAPVPRPWPLPRPIPYPDILPIPPLRPWPHPIPSPEILPIPTPNSWPIRPLRPWPHPIPSPEILAIPPLNPWPIPPLEPWPEPIPSPEILPIPKPNPWPIPPLRPWPQPIPSPEILPIPPLNPWPIPPLKPWPEPIPSPEILPIKPQPLVVIPIPLPEPDSACKVWNPGFVEEYMKALVLVEQAVMDIQSHIQIQEETDSESKRQFLAILALWRRLQDDTRWSGFQISTPVYKSIVQETVSLALNNPELVAQNVASWIRKYLDATANIRRIIKISQRYPNSAYIISSLVRQNLSLQLEANLLLQLGDASSSYLMLAPTFHRASSSHCVLPYLSSSQYDVMQLVERFRPAMRSLL